MACTACNKKKTNPAQKAITKVTNIAEGWIRVIIPDPAAEKTAADRLKICSSCNKRVRLIRKNQNKFNYTCAECGCILEAKVRAKDEVCDLGKW